MRQESCQKCTCHDHSPIKIVETLQRDILRSGKMLATCLSRYRSDREECGEDDTTSHRDVISDGGRGGGGRGVQIRYIV